MKDTCSQESLRSLVRGDHQKSELEFFNMTKSQIGAGSTRSSIDVFEKANDTSGSHSASHIHSPHIQAVAN